MPITGIEQPEILQIDENLRLRKFDGKYDFALEWYQDEEVVWLVDGVKNRYTPERLEAMYTWLNDHGELYFIEAKENGQYRPIGDVTFWPEDLPIVIGDPAYRGRGVGRKVVTALVERGRALGYTRMFVNEIYHYNTGSRKCFEHAGFRVYETTDAGDRMVIDL